MAARPRLLITGGSGYLGQFLVFGLCSDFKVVYTYGSRQLEDMPPGHDIEACKVDLVRGEGLEAAFQQHGPFAAVVNCAAISQPAVCEKDPGMARAVNVPTHLLACLARQQRATGAAALLVHVSTDQVYSGTRAMWGEGDACEPVNVYGRTKLEAEQAVQAAWPRHVVLRSSIIYGPQPRNPVPRTLFLQFVDAALAKGEPATFFEDEFRCPVYVGDVVEVVRRLVARADTLPPRQLYNMGGPERLSRVDMAHKVSEVWGHDPRVIVPVPSASVARGVVSPPDISMDVGALQHDLGLRLTPFAEGVKLTGRG